MKDEKEKWIASVFDSMEGVQRARPDAGLFARIEKQLDSPEAGIIPMYKLRLVAAAAIILLVLNISIINIYTRTAAMQSYEIPDYEISARQLISNYNLYD